MRNNVKNSHSSIVQNEIIENRILFIRGQKVMLGPHLAELYEVETRELMQSVRRNIDRFPQDFMFALEREEIMRISETVTSLKYHKIVYAFTEQGIAMLSGILNSKRAVQVNIAIMRIFVRLKQMVLAHKELSAKLAELERKIEHHDTAITAIFEAIRQIIKEEERPKKKYGFDTGR